MTDFPAPRRIRTNGLELSVHLTGPENGYPVLLCHGWPELAYSWKNQVPALAQAGFRVIAPDQRGYGASDAPADVGAYGVDQLVGDLTGLLDSLGHEKAVFAGHDWGGIVVWHAAMLARERVAGIIGVNTPHLRRAPADPISLLARRYSKDHYIVRFQERDAPERAFTGREEEFFAFTFGRARRPAPDDPRAIPPRAFELLTRFANASRRAEDDVVVSAADRAVYVEAYRASGFSGGVNWYRNLTANWERMEGVDYTIAAPSLMIAAANDVYLPPAYMAGMDALVPDLEKHVIPDCGHWTQWEAPDALNALMVDWLTRRFAQN